MTITRSKTAAAVIGAGLAAAVILEFVSNARLREENRLLSEQVAQLNQTRGDIEQSLKPQPSPPQPLAEEQSRELLRLRGEVGVLRRRLAEVRKAGERSEQGPQSQPQSDTLEQQRQMAMARLRYPRDWMLALIQYADQNQGQCPTSFDQVAPFLSDQAKRETNFAPDQFEIVYQGSLSDLTNRQNIIVIRQKEAEQSAGGGGGWIRAYGFADGHSEVHRATDGNFGPLEEQHRQKPAGQ